MRGGDSENPDSHILVNNQGTYSWNVTRIVQHSIYHGSDNFSILLQPELIFDNSGVVEGNYVFADSENSNIAIRPKLKLTDSTEASWIPPSPISLTPVDNSSIWRDNSPLPTTPDYINFQINSGLTNETAWNICRGNDLRWLFCETSNQLPPTYSWDDANNMFNYTDSQETPTVRVTTGSIGVLERIKPTASANILPSTNTAFHQILDIQTEIKTIQYNSMRIQFLHLQVQCHRLTMAVSILWI